MCDRVRKLKDQASSAYSEGRLKDALRLYGQVVETDPKELGCRIKVGDIHRRLGDRQAAIDTYRPAAKAYAEDGFLLKAIAVCKLILSIESDHTDTQQMLADLYAKRRGAVKPAFLVPPPVTLRQMGVDVHPDQEVRDVSAEYGVMIIEPTSHTAKEVVWPVSSASAGSSASDGVADSEVAWPVSGTGTREIDIALGRPLVEGEPDTPPPVQVGERLEDSSLHITVGEELIEGAAGEAKHPELPQLGMDATWSGEVRVQDVDGPILLKKTVERAPPAEGAGSGDDDLGDLGRPHIPLFSELPRNAFIELLVKMDMREAEPGTVLIREGNIGDAIFIVASGRVRVERTGDDGSPVVLAHLTDGAFFGEMALLQDGARTATVVVEEDSQILMISKEVLDHVVQRFPSVAAVLRNFYRQRLLSTTIATHPLFSPFDVDERRRLMELFKAKTFATGDILLEEGKKGTGLFILLHGALDVVQNADRDVPETIAELSSGDLFGEMSILTNRPMMATVRATRPCFVLRLSRRKFEEVIMTHPQILELVSKLSESRTEANDRVIEHKDRASRVLLV